jgi:hypothetical protein
VLAHSADCRERTAATLCDNTPAVSWRRKGSTTTAGPASYLLREASLHQREHRYLSVVDFINGIQNRMADDASRRFDLSDSQLLSLFNSRYPQTEPWQLRPLSDAMNLKLTSALQQRRPIWPSVKVVPLPLPLSGAKLGPPFASPWATTPTSPTSTIRSLSSACLASASAMGAPVGAVDRSGLAQFLTTSYQSQRGSPHWGPRTPASIYRASLMHASKVSPKA